jgi:hypothetical protein
MKQCPVCNIDVSDDYTGLCCNPDCPWEFELFGGDLSQETQTEYSKKLLKMQKIYNRSTIEICDTKELIERKEFNDYNLPKLEVQGPEKKAIADTVQKERSMNNVMGESNPEETVLGNGQISSLRSAIGLTDRFLFIREIFANNTDKYNTVIDQLDKLETIQQAVDYLKINLTLVKNDTSMRFVDFLKRRFTK